MVDQQKRTLEAAKDASLSYEARLATLEGATLTGAARLEGLALRGDMLRFLGRIEESEQVFQSLLALAKTDAATAAIAKVGLANAQCARAKWSEARALLLEVVGKKKTAFERPFLARVYAIIASTYFNEHMLDDAEHALEKAVEIQRSIRDRAGEAMSTTSLGIVAFARGESSRAFAYLDEGCAMARRIKLTHWEAMAKSYLAMLRHEAGELDIAASLYDESIDALDHLGVRRAEGITLFGRAILRFERRDFEGAVQDFRDALSEERATSPDYEPLLAAALAISAHARGDIEARDHQLRFARECSTRRGDRFAFVIDAIEKACAAHSQSPAVVTAPLRAAESIEGRLVARALDVLLKIEIARTLFVANDASWFDLDRKGRVDIARRRPLKRLVEAFVKRHREDANRPLSVESLVRAGWPDERLVGSTGATRLYTAIATLRKMGLDDVIERRGEGYALADNVIVERTE